ncbi:hypothetical protein HELRODRAFT_187901 [Helobdella robusta]|uniref:SH3 domain-containing protein n=1 Tax=Helobdella robusta TaxID=6412 RepID=T1FPG6_HELRO|nr:hypothetical protein HELRODRAFT_187901 [Helobdella robusta]ESO12508.1 hypothetical protein HELRODRAFT_187901 [Helobdella robusta]
MMKFFFYIHIQSLDEPFVFSCNAESERLRWIQVLNGDAGNNNHSYSPNNCVQVCAISCHVPRQLDELDVQAGDFLNLSLAFVDGWCEGERIRDGRRGWFKKECVRLVENEHVKMRNEQTRERFLTHTQPDDNK